MSKIVLVWGKNAFDAYFFLGDTKTHDLLFRIISQKQS
jgi:hypothetical protein